MNKPEIKPKESTRPDCNSCYGKRWYSQIIVISWGSDFPGDNPGIEQKLKRIACPKCNRNNRRKIKGVVNNKLS